MYKRCGAGKLYFLRHCVRLAGAAGDDAGEPAMLGLLQGRRDLVGTELAQSAQATPSFLPGLVFARGAVLMNGAASVAAAAPFTN